MRAWFERIALAAVLVFVSLGPTLAADSAPSDPAAATIASFYATLIDTMKQGKALGLAGREQKLAPAIDAAFDLPLMAQFMVGPQWAGMSQADQSAVVAAFRRYTIADYAHNFDSFDGQRFTVDPNVIVRGPDHIVQTQLVVPKGDPVALNYRMRQVGAKWQIVDVFLNGFVSELATRRSDFAATVASGGGAALAKKLNQLADEMK
ncbi:MAG TPA: ABC transporter substrate-binding protein [Rhizomicrobium sp.]|nr:ABC transporter substrate-binding protein [Rhizomicrobium sp.]